MPSVLYGLDPTGIPPRVVEELDKLTAAIQIQLGSFGTRVDIPYNSRYFSVDAGTITVNEGALRVFQYTVLGNYMIVFLDIQGITVTGSPNIITITAPEGFRVRPGDRHAALNSQLFTQPINIETNVGDLESGEIYVTNTSGVSSLGNSGSQVSMHIHQLDDGVFSSVSTRISIQGHCLFEFERA